MTARDRLSDVPVRARLAASRVRVGASNAWYRAAGRRISGTRQGISNARNQRTLERGRRPRTTQLADAARSSVPVYRNRINPATGRLCRAHGADVFVAGTDILGSGDIAAAVAELREAVV